MNEEVRNRIHLAINDTQNCNALEEIWDELKQSEDINEMAIVAMDESCKAANFHSLKELTSWQNCADFCSVLPELFRRIATDDTISKIDFPNCTDKDLLLENLLVLACKNGDLNLAKEIIEFIFREDEQEISNIGATLMYAVKANNLPLTKLLLEHGASATTYFDGVGHGFDCESGWPLIEAIELGYYEVFEAIINSELEGCLEDDCERELIPRVACRAALGRRDFRFLKFVLEKGFPICEDNPFYPDERYNTLEEIVTRYKDSEVFDFIIQYKGAIDVQSKNAEITLANVARESSLNNSEDWFYYCICKLLSLGVSANAQDVERGTTLLIFAILSFSPSDDDDSFIRLLMKKGADPDIKDNNGHDAWFWLDEKVKDIETVHELDAEDTQCLRERLEAILRGE